ncbi:hypothetical protein PB70LOC_03265 [Pectobacterium versatile]|uniref:hypothetical protein n=1 Tax=Pectobacterium versatile TaxID=2488639 RepID=UPI000CDEF957|nr:hypothetical protein [Pectobacterium versatile]POY57381.1 hypothetical protein PB70LOC_03265 [Pectobacterium versatile]POY61537.1 hypothetical protein PB69LOC_03504 [Pectobacterium versatile]
MTTLTNERLEEIKEMAVDAAKNYGSEWLSSLVGGSDGKYNAITSDLTNEVVVRTEDNTRESGWLCDYLEAVSPVAVVAIIDRLLSLEAQLAEAKSSWQIYEDAAKSAEERLAELARQEAVAWIVGSEEIDEFKRGREVTVMRDGDEEELEKIALYIRPVPQAVSQPYTVPEKMPHEVMALIESSADKLFDDDDAQEIWNACRAAMLQPNHSGDVADKVNSPVIPDGYCIMPLKLTAENGAKGALAGEFHISHTVTCHECGGEGCEDCNDQGSWEEKILIGWDTIKQIYQSAVDACSQPDKASL